jgi:NADH:ubiquinone oxidoreductase subunit B-like Fe-S oxidoreductase
MINKIKQKLLDWADTNYFEPTFFSGTDLIDDLICFLNSGMKKRDYILSDGFDSGERANLIIISGFINHKNSELLKLKYKNLNGKKYVLSAGFMVNNQLNFPEYNRAILPKDFLSLNEHIHGPSPTREDIVNAILRLER